MADSLSLMIKSAIYYNKMDGILVVRKEENYTSHDVVNIVKKTFNEKVGHTGTLDPLATGVLPLLIRKRYKNIKISHKS